MSNSARQLSYIIVERPTSFGSFSKFADALRQLRDLGYGGVEFNLTEPAGFELGELAKVVEGLDLKIVSFLSGANYAEGLCLSSPREEIRHRATDRLRSFTQIAAQFGAVLVVGQMQGVSADEPNRALGEARIEECMKRVVEAAERHGTTVVLEPIDHHDCGFHNTFEAVNAMAIRIGSKRFKPMLDSFHMQMEEKSPVELLARVGGGIGHFHLSETNGSYFGTGELDFSGTLEALETSGYPGALSLKVFNHPWADGAKASMQFMRELATGARSS